MRHNPETGFDEWVNSPFRIYIDSEKIEAQYRERMADLLEPSTRQDITTRLARLELHRRKGSLGEVGLPVFLEDLAGDLKALGISSLGMALLAQHLRTNARDQWFPAWDEIESAAKQIEAGLDNLRPQQQIGKLASPVSAPVKSTAIDQTIAPEPRQVGCYFKDWLALFRQRNLTEQELAAWNNGEGPPATV